MDPSTKKSLTRDLHRTAKGLGIPEGSADAFIARVIPAVEKSLSHKSIITESDLTRALVRELRKYNPDFAYVYEIRDIII